MIRLATAALITQPGYMDTAYYAAGGVQIAEAGTLNLPFIWNYLSPPPQLPHPGYLYWMPLPALLSGLSASVWRGSFFALQIPFAVLAAGLPVVAYALAVRIGTCRREAWVAALLTLFSGFFFPYWSLPETFAPFALAGSLALLLATRRQGALAPFAAGALVGVAHLTRADGVLLLPIVLIGVAMPTPKERAIQLRRLLLPLLGYCLVMGPWYVRNLAAIGAPLSPAGTKTLWLTDYDDLFCYKCAISPRMYLDWGWRAILNSKLNAMRTNLTRFVAENCLVFMLPFIVAGFYRLRRHLSAQLCLLYLATIFLAHSLAFTFPGPRGGFFHASAAALPFLYVAGVDGIDATVGWIGRRRRWNVRQAQRVFTTAAAIGAITLSVYASAGKIRAWCRADSAYRALGQWLDQAEGETHTVVMVGNPPAFWYHTHRYAVTTPNNSLDGLRDVVNQYDVDYIHLDRNAPRPLHCLYTRACSAAWLQAVEGWTSGTLYEVTD